MTIKKAKRPAKKPAKKLTRAQASQKIVRRKDGLRTRAVVLFVRFTEAEHAMIAMAAGDYPVSTWARTNLLILARGGDS